MMVAAGTYMKLKLYHQGGDYSVTAVSVIGKMRHYPIRLVQD